MRKIYRGKKVYKMKNECFNALYYLYISVAAYLGQTILLFTLNIKRLICLKYEIFRYLFNFFRCFIFYIHADNKQACSSKTILNNQQLIHIKYEFR